MTDKRLYDVINKAEPRGQSVIYKGIPCTARTCVTRLNRLTEENEQLRNRLEDWHQRTFKAHEYFNILEKVIDEVCDDDISNQIWKEYEKREKLIE